VSRERRYETRARQSRSRSPEGRRFPLIGAHLPRETFGVGIGIAIGIDHRNGEARITLKADSDTDTDSGPENHNFAVALGMIPGSGKVERQAAKLGRGAFPLLECLDRWIKGTPKQGACALKMVNDLISTRFTR
jgi:hypothetical protein